MPTDDVVEVIITAPDADWLAAFVHQLVEDRLAAGAHLITPIRSIYRWQDQIHDIAEARVAVHTLARHVAAVIDRANAVHPYEVPCVISVPVTNGSPAYLAWVHAGVHS